MIQAEKFHTKTVLYRDPCNVTRIKHRLVTIWTSEILFQMSGPGCIKQLKITWDFLQPFPALWKFSLHTIIDKSAEGG